VESDHDFYVKAGELRIRLFNLAYMKATVYDQPSLYARVCREKNLVYEKLRLIEAWLRRHLN
jgi:hypothetical protein